MPEERDGSTRDASWWQRPAGGREVARVALPLVVSSLSWTVMTFVDRMFLKWESGAAMAAAFAASTLWFAMQCLPFGICMYCATFVSQYYGSGQLKRIGPAVWQGIWLTLFVTGPLLLAIPVAPRLFLLTGHETQTVELETVYFQVLCYGIPALLAAQALSTFYAGRGKTRTVMFVDALVAGANVGLDYLWIFGHAGFPAMGIAGAGWATVTALWLKATIYVCLVVRPKYRDEFQTGAWHLDSQLFRRLIRYGGPSGFQLLLDVAGFTVFILIVGRLGVLEAEATSMVFSISTLAFMPIWGFAQAAGILVGQHLGEDRDDLAARATWSGLVISLAYMTGISLLYVTTPTLFLDVFFAGSEVAVHDASVRELAIRLLKFVAAYNLFDATLMIFVSAIKGAGDTQFVLQVSLIMSLALAGLTWLGVEAWHMGVYGCWSLVTAWIWALGLIYLLRFLQGKWRSMRVIETCRT